MLLSFFACVFILFKPSISGQVQINIRLQCVISIILLEMRISVVAVQDFF